MKHLFVPQPLALLAKEKGFDEECLAVYKNAKDLLPANHVDDQFNDNCNNGSLLVYISAPLYQQLVDWFEEFHKIEVESPKKCALGYLPHLYKDLTCVWQGGYFETKKEALNAALTEAFKLIP